MVLYVKSTFKLSQAKSLRNKDVEGIKARLAWSKKVVKMSRVSKAQIIMSRPKLGQINKVGERLN